MKHLELTEELQEKALLYAAGALDQVERDEYTRHLEQDGCAVCLAEVRESEAAAQSLAMLLPMQLPSDAVKQRLLARARAATPSAEVLPFPERRRSSFSWIGWAAVAASLLLAGILLNWNAGLRREVETLNARVVELESQITEQQTLLASLTSPSTKTFDLAGLGSTPRARARVFADDMARQWRVYVEDLPAVPSDRIYELWFVPAAGNPVRAEVFNTDANGVAMFQVSVPAGIGTLKAAAVTNEPAGGSDLPTTTAFNLLGTME